MKLEQFLRTAVSNEHRAIANMLAVTIRSYRGRNDAAIQAQWHFPEPCGADVEGGS
jgi:hypothetical protein